MLCPRHPDANNLIGMCPECLRQPNQDGLRLDPNPRIDHEKRGRKPVRGMSLHRGSSRVEIEDNPFTRQSLLGWKVTSINAAVDAQNRDTSPAPLPWPSYPTTPVDRIPGLMEDLGVPPSVVAAYELEHENRSAVLDKVGGDDYGRIEVVVRA